MPDAQLTSRHLKILHLEDVATDAALVDIKLNDSGLLFEKLLVEDKAGYINALQTFLPDIILSDHSLPSFSSVEALNILKQSGLKVPFILVTATVSEEFAVDIIKDGATDYVLKDRMHRLPSAIINAVERKEAEDLIESNLIKLREASETQTAILNALPPSIALLNEAGKIVAVNQSWRALALQNNLGIPNYGAGFNYLTIAEKAMAIDKASIRHIDKGLKDVIAGHVKEFTIEYSANSPAGKIWFQLIAAPLADGTKGAVVLHINITDRKKAEQQLLQSEANLRSVFENTDLCIAFYDTDFNIVSFNNNAYDFVRDYLHQKLKAGKNAVKYFPKNRRASVRNFFNKASNNEPVFYETFYDLGHGNIVWFDVNWVGVKNEKGENIGVILTYKNITKSKNADIEREKITADLIQRNKDLEQFTYIISHNLRAPVANIIGLSNLLQGADNETKQRADVLNALSTSANNLDEVILDLNHILQVNRETHENAESVDIAGIIGDIKTSINQQIAKENVTIETDFKEVSSFFTLKSYMHSILYNLIINSIKYRRIDVPPIISIKSLLKDDKVVLTYRDNGKGIDMDKNGKHLFGLYKRFDFTVDGKGMGLFMVKVQTENLDGTITVQSELNKGTEFKFEFPASFNAKAIAMGI